MALTLYVMYATYVSYEQKKRLDCETKPCQNTGMENLQMTEPNEYAELRAAGLSDEQIKMLRNTGATHQAILFHANTLGTAHTHRTETNSTRTPDDMSGIVQPLVGMAVIANSNATRMGFLTEQDVLVLANDPETRLTQVLVRCGNGRFVCAAQDVQHFIGIIDRERGDEGNEDSDYIRDCSLNVRPVASLKGGE